MGCAGPVLSDALGQGSLRYTCHAWNGEEWESTGDHCMAECTWDETSMRLAKFASSGEEAQFTGIVRIGAPLVFSADCIFIRIRERRKLAFDRRSSSAM